jgi:hypothetical protein
MQMKSAPRGRGTSTAEVTNVSPSGFWLLLDGAELFVWFKHFPWFKDASIGQLVKVERPSAGHLYWPDLDVDLAVESLAHPERYPLVSRLRARATFEPPAAPATGAAKKRKSRAARPRR